MHANNDSLGVRSAIRFREQMRREGLLEFASPPNWLSSSGRITILGSSSRKCLEVIVVPVDKIVWRCRQVTDAPDQELPIFAVSDEALEKAAGGTTWAQTYLALSAIFRAFSSISLPFVSSIQAL
jgi:hypothetical protein